jgi:hypothetical protein
VLANKPNATPSDRAQAIRYAENSCRLTGYLRVESLLSLADAYTAAGQLTQAATTTERAMKLAISSDQHDLAQEIQKRLQLYQKKEPQPSKVVP